MPIADWQRSLATNPMRLYVRRAIGDNSCKCPSTVIEDVLSSRDRIQGIQGVAGAGKTTVLDAIRAASETKGYQIEGFAPTSRAAKQLQQAGVHSGTLQGFLARPQEAPAEQRKFFF